MALRPTTGAAPRGLRNDGHLDFAVYTDKGELTDRSTFATMGGTDFTSASPYSCMACHIRVSDLKVAFSDTFPEGTGAGCKN